MSSKLVDRLAKLIRQNRPSRKPQLWEDLPLAVLRRAQLEIGRRIWSGWMDSPRVVKLSRVGNDAEAPATRMSLLLRDSIAQAVFLYGTYEICGTRLLQSFLRPGMTFVDVGANVGYYSLLAAGAVGATGGVYAFEPNAPVRARLEENLRLNGLAGQVQVRQQAVTRSSGEINFYRSVASDNSGLSSIIPGAGRADEAEVVPCVSLDDFAASLPGRRSIDLIKVDVEGAELEVLSGGGALLARDDAPAIIFESRDLAEIEARLRGYGYTVRRPYYTLAGGLEFIELGTPFRGIFDDYEPPNYFAVKDRGVFQQLVQRTSARPSAALRLLGRV